jgi:hypothetical protein
MSARPLPPFPKQHQRAPGSEGKLRPRPRFEARRYRAAGKLKDKIALITGGDATLSALRHEAHRTVSSKSLGRQAHRSAARRGASARHASAMKAARTERAEGKTAHDRS